MSLLQSGWMILGATMLLAQPAMAAQGKYPDAVASDPAKLGWMVGSPPPADKQLRFDDGSYFRFPAMRWSVANFRQLMPTVNVSRGLGHAQPLVSQEDSAIDQLTFMPTGADKPMSWEASLLANYTDAIVVLHKGKVVYERYFGVMSPTAQHGVMSVTKPLSARWPPRWWPKASSMTAKPLPIMCRS